MKPIFTRCAHRCVSLCTSLVAIMTLAALPLGAQADELTVSAAASLTNAFQEIGKAFEANKPGTKVTFNFAASGPLLRQIEQGAPVDVFASADQETVDRAAAGKLIDPGTRLNFAANALVVIVPNAGTPPKDLAALSSDVYKRVSTGNPATVPVGRYTRGVLTDANLWEPLQPKMVFAESVRQVLQYVSRGEVDAGFVYMTDALIDKEHVKVAFSVPTKTPVTYPIAQVAASKNAALSKEFIAFVVSPTGTQILAKYGFSKP